tara:strand:+ start:683 stop:1918 length:1236 start_codon:yes stop_codon:yes gene_type:complete
MVPNGWDVIKLRDVGKCLTGLTYSPKNVVDNGLLVLRSSNVQDSKLAFEDNVYVDLDVPKEGRTKHGDILLCVRNGSRRLIGKSAFITQEAEGYAHGAFMGLFRPIDTPDYTFQLFQSESFFKQVNQNLGATINSINSGNLYDFKFPYPPIQEREKIAKILSTWDKAISTTERLIDNSTQQKKALMQQLLTGKKRLLDEAGKRFEGEWESLTIGDVVELFNGYAFKSSDALEKGYKWLKIANVGIGEIKWDNSSYLPEGYKDEYNRFNLKVGDVVVAMTRPTLGNQLKIARLKNKADESLLNQRVAKLLFSEKVSSEYMYQLLSTIEVALKLNHALLGTDPPNLSTKVLHEISMELPPLIEQQKIATVLTNADKEIELLEQQLADLQQEKKALMQVLLTGKKRVVVDGEVK